MSDRRSYLPRREPGDLIPPTQKRHSPKPPPTPEDQERDVAIALSFRATMLSHRLGLEIQAACGLCPPDKAQRDGLKTQRSIAASWKDDRRLPAKPFAVLQGAFDTLLARRACSHCEARFECRAKRRRSRD